MSSFNNSEFYFQESKHGETNTIGCGKERRRHYNESENERKMIISDDQRIGINLEQHLNKIQAFYEEKLLRENIKKSVIKNFERKKIIAEGEFKIESAFQDASNQSKAYVDKIQTWLGDSIAHSVALDQFAVYKDKKIKERAGKVNRIMDLIDSISEKVQNKKIEQIKEDFSKALEDRQVKVQQNKQYAKCTERMKAMNQSLKAKRRSLEADREQLKFSHDL